jgi:hypothetical protein
MADRFDNMFINDGESLCAPSRTMSGCIDSATATSSVTAPTGHRKKCRTSCDPESRFSPQHEDAVTQIVGR